MSLESFQKKELRSMSRSKSSTMLEDKSLMLHFAEAIARDIKDSNLLGEIQAPHRLVLDQHKPLPFPLCRGSLLGGLGSDSGRIVS